MIINDQSAVINPQSAVNGQSPRSSQGRMVRKIMKMDTFRVPMPPHGLLCSGIEAYSLQEAFASVPGPPGPQKRTKNINKKNTKTSKNDFCRIFCRIFSFKRDVFSAVWVHRCGHPLAIQSSTPCMPVGV